MPKLEQSDIKPHSLWIFNRGEDRRFPRDAVTILTVTDDQVEFAPMGGGFGHRGSTAKFLEDFRQVTPEEMLAKEPQLAFFSFDWGPTVLGFTYGGRWNGWGKPLLEKTSAHKWIEKTFEPGDTWFLKVSEDGALIHHDENQDDDEKESVITPELIVYKGVSYEVYDFDLGWCWNQVEPEDVSGLEGEAFTDCLHALTPPGLDTSDVIADSIREPKIRKICPSCNSADEPQTVNTNRE